MFSIPGGIGLILSAFLVSITMGAAELNVKGKKLYSRQENVFWTFH